jgi:hypothetical protein
MISTDIQEVLNQLKLGRFDRSQVDSLDRLSPVELIADLRGTHPIVFQERRIRDKHEIGLARKVGLQTVAAKIPGSRFFRFDIILSIKSCLFISSYSESLSELTVLSDIRVRPKGGPNQDVILKMGLGHKLDKTPDGWSVKPLKSRPVKLSESLLVDRGWRFEVLEPFSSRK